MRPVNQSQSGSAQSESKAKMPLQPGVFNQDQPPLFRASQVHRPQISPPVKSSSPDAQIVVVQLPPKLSQPAIEKTLETTNAIDAQNTPGTDAADTDIESKIVPPAIEPGVPADRPPVVALEDLNSSNPQPKGTLKFVPPNTRSTDPAAKTEEGLPFPGSKVPGNTEQQQPNLNGVQVDPFDPPNRDQDQASGASKSGFYEGRKNRAAADENKQDFLPKSNDNSAELQESPPPDLGSNSKGSSDIETTQQLEIPPANDTAEELTKSVSSATEPVADLKSADSLTSEKSAMDEQFNPLSDQIVLQPNPSAQIVQANDGWYSPWMWGLLTIPLILLTLWYLFRSSRRRREQRLANRSIARAQSREHAEKSNPSNLRRSFTGIEEEDFQSVRGPTEFRTAHWQDTLNDQGAHEDEEVFEIEDQSDLPIDVLSDDDASLIDGSKTKVEPIQFPKPKEPALHLHPSSTSQQRQQKSPQTTASQHSAIEQTSVLNAVNLPDRTRPTLRVAVHDTAKTSEIVTEIDETTGLSAASIPLGESTEAIDEPAAGYSVETEFQQVRANSSETGMGGGEDDNETSANSPSRYLLSSDAYLSLFDPDIVPSAVADEASTTATPSPHTPTEAVKTAFLELNEENESLKQELAAALEKIDSLQAQCDELQEQTELLTNAQHESQQRADVVTDANQLLEQRAELAALGQSLQLLDSEKQELANQLRLANEQNQQLMQQQDQLTENYNALVAEQRHWESEREQFHRLQQDANKQNSLQLDADQLRLEADQLKASLAELSQDFQLTGDSYKSAMDEVDSLKRELEQKQYALDLSLSEKRSIEDRLAEIQSKAEESAQAHASDLTTIQQELSSALIAQQAAESRTAELQQQLTALQKSHEELQQQGVGSDELLQKERATRNSLVIAKTNLESNVAALTNQAKDLHVRISELEAELMQNRAARERLQGEREKFESLSRQLEEQTQSLAENSAELEKLRAEKIDQSELYESLRSEYATLESNLRQLQDQSATGNMEVTRVQAELKALQSSLLMREAELAEARQTIQKQVATVARISELELNLTQTRNERSRAQQESESAVQRAAQVEQGAAQSEQQANELREKLAAAEQQLVETEKQLQQFTQQTQQIPELIEELQQSRTRIEQFEELQARYAEETQTRDLLRASNEALKQRNRELNDQITITDRDREIAVSERTRLLKELAYTAKLLLQRETELAEKPSQSTEQSVRAERTTAEDASDALPGTESAPIDNQETPSETVSETPSEKVADTSPRTKSKPRSKRTQKLRVDDAEQGMPAVGKAKAKRPKRGAAKLMNAKSSGGEQSSPVKRPSAAKNSDQQQDDLTLISGIGDVFQQRLHEHGIFRFEQIMNWDQQAMKDVADQIPFVAISQLKRWAQEAAKLLGER
jgi:predicted flap endonuclease-1-like 5' DNA nuclease/predicted  nucleic acid-binding Zn-ribbon protein